GDRSRSESYAMVEGYHVRSQVLDEEAAINSATARSKSLGPVCESLALFTMPTIAGRSGKRKKTSSPMPICNGSVGIVVLPFAASIAVGIFTGKKYGRKRGLTLALITL